MSTQEELRLKAVDVTTGDDINFSYVGDELHVELNEPWAGDTEAGFGRSCSITLTREQAVTLLDWLKGRLA